MPNDSPFAQIDDDFSVSPSFLGNLPPVSSEYLSSVTIRYAYNQIQSKLIIISKDIGQQSPSLHKHVEPVPEHRFRYKTELKAPNSQKKQFSTHGTLDVQDDNKRKFPPTISLRNFRRSAIIRCELYQVVRGEMFKLHPHRLCRIKENGMEYGPIYEIANEHNNWTVQFPGLSIINTKKEDITKTLIEKETEKLKWCPADERVKNGDESDVLDLHRVALGFEAYECISDGINQRFRRIAGPILSAPICNSGEVSVDGIFFIQNYRVPSISDNVATGKLKICGISMKYDLLLGGATLFMFVEKVNKSEDMLLFFERIGLFNVM